MFGQLSGILLLIFGFGFVIFFHELGHFLAAKWVGIRVEQFAVGFGQALVSWRRGMGAVFGSTGKKYEELVERGAAQGLGETEYRLNWIPLGGYVKMLGQDDMKPNAKSEDPRAYNRKSIGARMFVVSAGVIMNILLAGIGFMVLFLIGFNVQPAVVGSVQPNSPAAKTTLADGKTPAPLQVGDRVLYFDDKYQHDFTKITLNVALSGTGPVPMYVERADGRHENLLITPKPGAGDASGILMIGIGQPAILRGMDKKDWDAQADAMQPELVPAQLTLVKPGDVITAVNGQPVKVGDEKTGVGDEYWKLDRAVQQSDGNPVTISIRSADGKLRDEQANPRFMPPFAAESLSFAGMYPRAEVQMVNPESPAHKKLLPGDVVVKIAFADGADPLFDPTEESFKDRLNKSGHDGKAVDITVLRGGQEVVVKGLTPNIKVAKDRYGLSIGLSVDDQHPVIAGVEKSSPAQAAGLAPGDTVTAINGQPVKTWFDVKRLLSAAKPDATAKISVATTSGAKEHEIKLSEEQIREVAGLGLGLDIALHDRIEPRKTSNPLVAAAWGTGETRDFVLQFYMTLHRMFQGSVSYKNMMGPVGIFNAGRHFANRGMDWLLWFLSMISANLAVVNFLPIPIVDGGLFTFLIIEKIQGKPLSPKMQSIAQMVGLAIILSVFLLVTYQDVTRHTGW